MTQPALSIEYSVLQSIRRRSIISSKVSLRQHLNQTQPVKQRPLHCQACHSQLLPLLQLPPVLLPHRGGFTGKGSGEPSSEGGRPTLMSRFGRKQKRESSPTGLWPLAGELEVRHHHISEEAPPPATDSWLDIAGRSPTARLVRSDGHGRA
ncbi:hypothetical protein BGW80DRAFT_631935 [Lactifluus volemus]|nr:hypothetical protein BGW80DRAFT_631935 [Lactifluus volemus]